MGTLQRSCTVTMPVDQAERSWNAFVTQQQAGGQTNGDPREQTRGNAGTVYFAEVGKGQTEVTMQLDPEGIVDADEAELNQRVDAYLQRFKEFVEAPG